MKRVASNVIHVDSVNANNFMQEIFVSFIERYNELLTKPLQIDSGFAKSPDGIGWGADLNLEVLSKYPPVEFKQVESEPCNTL